MNGQKSKKRLLNTLSKKMIVMFVIMTVLISCSSCLLGYLKYSETIKQLYNENSYSIANIVSSELDPETGDFLEALIVYETDENGEYILNEYGKKIPKMHSDGTNYYAETAIDIYADPGTLEGEALDDYNRYYELLDRLDSIRKSSGAKYLFLSFPCDGNNADDPYYENGQGKYDNPYAIYFADSRVEDETLKQINLSDPEIIALAKSLGTELTQADLRDENGELYDWVYTAFCRLGPGMQTRLAPEIYSDAHDVYLTGNKSDNYFQNSTDYGTTTEALLPFRNSDGEVVGLIAVDVEMSIIRSTLASYITSAILATVVLVSLFMFAFLFYMQRKVVSPVKKITVATSSFINGQMTISDDLANIKTGDEIEALSNAFSQMSSDILEYINNLATVTAEKERIGAELNIATQIQASMLPCIFPPFPNHTEFDIYATMQPAKEVGGDFYDFFLVDDDHLAVVMADVSGKGVPAALFMVIAKTLIKNHAQAGERPADVFTNTNRQLCENNEAGMFVTAWMGVLEISTGAFVYVNAGHNPPLLKRSDGSFEYLKSKPGFVLAGMEGIRYRQAEMQLEVGDMLYLYTDGVTEATDINNQLYGEERLRDILNKNTELSEIELLPAVKTDIDRFVGEAPQFDDITMLGLKIRAQKNHEKAITLPAEVESLAAATDFADEFLDSLNCPSKYKIQLAVAIDEIFSNIAHYAYGSNSGTATIRFRYSPDENAVYLTFTDSGMPYNPLEKQDPDVTLSLKDREIGGLGIFMVKKSMDDMTYEYKDSHNVLTLKKIIGG